MTDAAPLPAGPPTPAPAPEPEPSAPPTCPACGQQTYSGELRPGAMLRPRFVKVEALMVLEIEGDGTSGWFTARFPDMSTWRMRREEVEVIPAPVQAKPPGQYL